MDWAQIWFAKLAKFHNIKNHDQCQFTPEQVVAFLRARLQAGTPAWKRLMIVKSLIVYRNRFLRSKTLNSPRELCVRSRLAARIGIRWQPASRTPRRRTDNANRQLQNNLVEPWAYLGDVFTRLAHKPSNEQLTLLLPAQWLIANPHQRWESAQNRREERE